MTTLILYLSREGQTARIAQRIAATLQATGAAAEALPLDDAAVGERLARAQRIVIGASIHYGHFPLALQRFITAHRASLAPDRCAFFAVSLSARKPGRDRPERAPYLQRFFRRSAWQPAQCAIFAGALDYPRYTWYDRTMIRLIMTLSGGPTDPATQSEYTDWAKVAAFARQLH